MITGGTGFIGHKLCASLLDHGHKVTVLSRRPNSVPSLCGNQVEGFESFQSLPSGRRFDILINLSGEPIADKRWTKRRKRLLRASRIGVTKQAIDYIATAKHRPRALISASAVGYYGNQKDALLDENSAFLDDFGHQLCSEWEISAMAAANYGVRVCILRIGLVIGKGGGFLQRMLIPFRLGLGGRFGDGRQWMSWVSRSDVVAMIEHLMNTPQLHGVFNGTAPNPVTNVQFTRKLASALNRPALLPLPASALKMLFGEMSALLLEGQRVIPRRFLTENFKFEVEHLDQALFAVLNGKQV